jgi:hypothetical protein
MAKLHITIDNASYTVIDDDQEAAALLRLAGRDPHVFDLFVVTSHGIEERVRDGRIVDLRDGARFVTRQKVQFTIDGEQYGTYDDDQTAGSLLRLAGVDPADYDLARASGVGGVEMFQGDQIVTIKDGDEFVTARRVGGVA